MTGRRTSWRRWFLALAALPLLAVVALSVAYLAIDRDMLRTQLAAQLSALTGRPVTISGELDLALSADPTFVVGQVSVGNPDWAEGPALLRVGRIEGQLALRPLWSGEVHVRRLTLFDTELFLESGPQGEGNWEWRATPAPATEGEGEGAASRVDRLGFERLRLGWRGADGDAGGIAIDRLELSGIGSASGIRVEGAADGAGTPRRPPWRVGFDLTTAGAVYRVRNLALRAGESDLQAALDISESAGRWHLEGDLSAGRLRPVDITALIAGDASEKDHGMLAGRVFASQPVVANIPRSLVARLGLRVDRLGNSATTLEDVSLQLAADGGVLRFDALRARYAGATLSAELEVDTTADVPALRLDFDGEHIPFGRLVQPVAGRHWLDGDGDMALRLRGSGRSVAEIMASLSGSSRLLIGEGRADLRDVDALIGGLSTALGTLTDRTASQARLNCVAGSFRIDRGIAHSQLLMADTEHSTVYGEGRINLRSERLALVLTPKPKRASLNVAVPVEVGGTLANPTFTPEKLATARKGAGVLAAVGLISFPPAILLGLGELGSGDNNPCLAVAASGGGTGSPRVAHKEKGLIRRTADEVDAAIDGIGATIKGLFD